MENDAPFPPDDWGAYVKAAQPGRCIGTSGSLGEWAPLWNRIIDWWERWDIDHPGDPEPLQRLLTALRENVPQTQVENGIERQSRHLRVSDDASAWAGKERWKGGAQILELEELEAAVEGEPPEASVLWDNDRQTVEAWLQEFVVGDEPTKGDPELSRRHHARQALELLRSLDFISAAMRNELATDDDRVWLDEIIASVVHTAFHAGRHTHVASGKAFEDLAAQRKKSIDRFARHSEGRDENIRERQEKAKAWHAHAESVIATLDRAEEMKNASLSKVIVKRWDKVGDPQARPEKPAAGTVRNWLGRREKAARTGSRACSLRE